MGFGFWGSEVFVFGWSVGEKVLTKGSPSCGGFWDEPDLEYIFVHEDNCSKEEKIRARSGDEGHIVIEFEGFNVQVLTDPVSPLNDRMSGIGFVEVDHYVRDLMVNNFNFSEPVSVIWS